MIKILNKLIFCVCLYLTHTSVSVACSLYTEVANAAQLDAAIVCFNSESAGPGEYKVILTDNIVPYNAFTPIEKKFDSHLSVYGKGYSIFASVVPRTEYALFTLTGWEFLDRPRGPTEVLFENVQILDSTVPAIIVSEDHHLILRNSRIFNGDFTAISVFAARLQVEQGSVISGNRTGILGGFESFVTIDNSKIDGNLENGISVLGPGPRLRIANQSSISYNGHSGISSQDRITRTVGERNVWLEGSRVVGNGANGVYLAGVVESYMSNMTIANNAGIGAFIYPTYGQFTIAKTTISGNARDGLNIIVIAPVLVSNSTISGNTGSGILLRNDPRFSGDVVITHSTIVENENDGVRVLSGVPMRMFSTLLANNSANNCSSGAGSIYDSTVVSDDNSCGSVPAASSARHYDPLDNNGCRPWVSDEAYCPETHKIFTTSAAYNASSYCDSAPTSPIPLTPALTDQRGFFRNFSCSAGAFEPNFISFPLPLPLNPIRFPVTPINTTNPPITIPIQ